MTKDKKLLERYLEKIGESLENAFHQGEIQAIFEKIKQEIDFLRKNTNWKEKRILNRAVDQLFRFHGWINHTHGSSSYLDEKEIEIIYQFEKHILKEFKDKEKTDELLKAVAGILDGIREENRFRKDIVELKLEQQKLIHR